MSRKIRETRLAVVATALGLGAALAGCAPSRQVARTIPEHPPPVEQRVASAPPAEVRSAEVEEAEVPAAGAVEFSLSPDEPFSESPLDELATVDPAPPDTALEASRGLVAEQAPTFDMPIEVNDRVLAWVDHYSRTGKQSFEAGLRRSGRYLEMFRDIFAEAGVPRDLVYMAHVESGYKTTAYSRAHARGVFQFIASTGRRYGLRVDYWVDERADPEKSARAAAAYMKDLYAEFGDWYLALAAYNAGEGKIRRALARSGHSDFWGIARTRYIRRETKNHIPAILAATLLSKQPEKYGLTFEPEPPLEYDTLEVHGAADLRVLARCAGTDPETMRRLNPALRRNQTPPNATTEVRLPPGTAATTRAALDAIPSGERVLYARHVVRSGDTLSEIADRYGVSVAAIQSTNGMGRRTLIRVNQVLKVPTSAASRYAAVDEPGASDGPRGEVLTYRVRRGDTLYAIARRYGTTPSSIAAASDIPVNSILHVGDRLQVVRGVRSPAEARRVAGGAEAGDGTRVVHTVRRGDTLWAIASLYRTSVNVLCSLNRISPQAILRPGVKLTVGYR